MQQGLFSGDVLFFSCTIVYIYSNTVIFFWVLHNGGVWSFINQGLFLGQGLHYEHPEKSGQGLFSGQVLFLGKQGTCLCIYCTVFIIYTIMEYLVLIVGAALTIVMTSVNYCATVLFQKSFVICILFIFLNFIFFIGLIAVIQLH